MCKFWRAMTKLALSFACVVAVVAITPEVANAKSYSTISLRSDAGMNAARTDSPSASICALYQSWCNASLLTASYPSYGNDAKTGLGNCTFASVANWEQIVLGIHPDARQLAIEFAAAGGSKNVGLTNDQVLNYWRDFGISGIYLKSAKGYYVDAQNLKYALDTTSVGAVIAQIKFVAGGNFGGYQFSHESFHWLVVDGYTSTGPVVVTWGKTIQMTWDQWKIQAVSMWGITTS